MYALIRSFWCQLTRYSRWISVPFTHRLPQRRCTVSPLSTQLWIETVSLFRHSHPPVVLLTPRVLTKISWHVYHVYSTFIAPRSGCDTAVTLFQDVSSAWNRHRCHTLAICRSAARAQGLKIFSSESCVHGCVCVCVCVGVCVRACVWETEEGVLGYEVEGLLSASELEVFEGLLRSSAFLPLFYFHPSLRSCHM